MLSSFNTSAASVKPLDSAFKWLPGKLQRIPCLEKKNLIMKLSEEGRQKPSL